MSKEIEYMTGRILAIEAAINALVIASPQEELLAQAVRENVERVLAHALNTQHLSDETIAGIVATRNAISGHPDQREAGKKQPPG